MNSIFDIDSSDNEEDFNDPRPEREFNENTTTTSTEHILGEITTLNDQVIDNIDEDIMRVDDFLVPRTENTDINVSNDRNIRRLNLHDCALFLARDRARKKLNRQKNRK